MYCRERLSIYSVARLLTSAIVVAGAAASYARPAHAYFPTLSAHSVLPSEVLCSSLIKTTSWEPRPENAPANKYIPSVPELAAFHAEPLNFIDGPPNADFTRVDGNYSGTTDMIIRWAACKWGMDENLLRAQAFWESTWTSTAVGDLSTNQANCAAGAWNGWQPQDYCWESYGITQVKVLSYNAWPMAWTSSAFNLDFRAAYWRACMNGDVLYYYWDVPSSGYPAYSASGNTSQMQWGCIGSWYSGEWYDPAALSYIADIENLYNTRPWRALPAVSSPALSIITPAPDQIISGPVNISIHLNQTNPKACYACLSLDGVHQTCTPATGPWSWNTTQNVLNGIHSIQVDAYNCSGGGPNYHAGINVTVAN